MSRTRSDAAPHAQSRAALDHLEIGHAASRGDFDVIREALEYCINRGRWDLVGGWAQRARTVAPHDWLTLYSTSFAYGLSGRYDLAIPVLQELGMRYPDVDILGMLLAEAHISNCDLPAAAEVLRQALQTVQAPPPWLADGRLLHEYMQRMQAIIGRIELLRGDPAGFGNQLGVLQRANGYIVPELAGYDEAALTGQLLLVTRVGGCGDVMLYGALLPQLAQHAAHIILTVQPALQSLLQASLPRCTVLAAAAPPAANAAPDDELRAIMRTYEPTMHTTLLHLPLLFAREFPAQQCTFAPYLRVPDAAHAAVAADVAEIRARAAGRRVVGIAWDRAQQHQPEIFGKEACLRQYSSLPLAELCRIIQHPDVTQACHFVMLHESDVQRTWPEPWPDNLSRITLPSNSFATTAALMDACDEIYSVDMSIANLAVMLGLPTTVMLCYEGEWRWGQTGPTSPWLSGVHCLRQPRPNDWATVGDAAIGALAAATKPA